IDHPLAASQRAHERTGLIVQVEMLEPAALGGPDEAARVSSLFERPEHIMKVDPDRAGLAQECATFTAAWVEPHQIEHGLLAVLDLCAQAAVWQPVDSRQVDILISGQVHPDRLAAFDRDNAKAYFGVRRAGEGVTM